MKRKNIHNGFGSTVLVTGGAGFIGCNLSDKLLKLGFKVIIFDNFQTGKRENVTELLKSKNCSLVEGDVNIFDEIAPVFLKNKIDYVFHYAACVGVDRTLAHPISVLADIEGIKNILSLSAMTKIKRIFYSSSSEVYGESPSFPQNEMNTPLNSRLPYAVVKNLGEVFIKTYHKEYGLDYTIFRFFNTYGPKQSDSFVMTKFIKQALENKDITIYGDGSQTRTFFYVGDNAEATSNAIFMNKSINQVINVGNNIETPIKVLAENIIKVTGSKSKLKFLPPLIEGDMPRRMPDISLMGEILNVAPNVSLEDGIRKTVKYFKDKTQNGKDISGNSGI